MDIKEPEKKGSSSIVENTAQVFFGDSTYTIQRLKAGKFYEALKLYMDMIKDLTKNNVAGSKNPTNEEGKAPLKEEKEEVDFDKLIVSMFQTWPEKMMKFIVVCCSTIKLEEGQQQITEAKIKEDAYPEQITESFRTCMTLNRVAENLKNFVAPIGELGAEVQQVKA